MKKPGDYHQSVQCTTSQWLGLGRRAAVHAFTCYRSARRESATKRYQRIQEMSLSKGEKEADAAADQLASISLTGSDGATTAAADSENKETKSNSTVVIEKFCSNCGEAGVANTDLKLCNSCKCVWYCSAACQRAHWKGHKKECKEIREVLEGQDSGAYPKTERRSIFHDPSGEYDPSFFDNMPPRQICEICMLPFPHELILCTYMACCSKKACGGCVYTKQQMEITSNKKQFCPFCRTPPPETLEENFRRILKRADTGDVEAMVQLAKDYEEGFGTEKDPHRALELYFKAVDLGSAEACDILGNKHTLGGRGLPINKEMAKKYFKLGAKRGDTRSCEKLAYIEVDADNISVAFRLLQISSSSGSRSALGNIILMFQYGEICHGDLAECLQAFYKAAMEMRSKHRNEQVEYLKRLGHYDPESGWYKSSWISSR